MSYEPILNPPNPYVGAVEGGLMPGKMVKVRGKVPPNAALFAVNYQLGPTLNPRDDIAIHVSPRFQEGYIARNNIVSGSWGPEEGEGPMWIKPGEDFEILILCDYNCYKIAINGRHFTEFVHRLPYQKVTHLVVDGDVELHSIAYEIVSLDPPRLPSSVPVPNVPAANFGPPYGEMDHKPKTESEGGGLANLGLGLGAALANSLVTNALNKSQTQQGYPAQQPSSGGGLLGSILGALGGSGGTPAPPPPPPSQPSDPLTGALGSILGGVLGTGGNQQPSYQPSGGYGNYQPSGGYPSQQSNAGSDLLSGIGSAIGSSLLNSAVDVLTKHGKDKPQEEHRSAPPPAVYTPSPSPAAPASNNSSDSGNKLTADEISKGLA